MREPKNICCPICGSKVMTYDGRATITQLVTCRNCRKNIIYNPSTDEITVKDLERHRTSSGCQF